MSSGEPDASPKSSSVGAGGAGTSVVDAESEHPVKQIVAEKSRIRNTMFFIRVAPARVLT
jgi:hypothetical protein